MTSYGLCYILGHIYPHGCGMDGEMQSRLELVVEVRSRYELGRPVVAAHVDEWYEDIHSVHRRDEALRVIMYGLRE